MNKHCLRFRFGSPLRAALGARPWLPLISGVRPPASPPPACGAAPGATKSKTWRPTSRRFLHPRGRGESFSPLTVYSLNELAGTARLADRSPAHHARLFPVAVNTEQRTNGRHRGRSSVISAASAGPTLLDGPAPRLRTTSNVLPTIALQRIEVVKGRRSAVYGAVCRFPAWFNTVWSSISSARKVDLYYATPPKTTPASPRVGLIAGADAGGTDLVVGGRVLSPQRDVAADRDVSADADGRRPRREERGAGVSGRVTARVGDPAGTVQDLVLRPA